MNLTLFVFCNITYLRYHIVHLVAVARLISAFKLATWDQGPKSTFVLQFVLNFGVDASVMLVFFHGVPSQLKAKT